MTDRPGCHMCEEAAADGDRICQRCGQEVFVPMAPTALRIIIRQADRIEQLERWKREATEVLNGWDAVVAEVPMGDVDLGRTKAQAVAAYIKHLLETTP